MILLFATLTLLLIDTTDRPDLLVVFQADRAPVAADLELGNEQSNALRIAIRPWLNGR